MVGWKLTLEEGWLLGHKRKMFAVIEDVDFGDVLAIAQDAAFVEIIESVAHKNISSYKKTLLFRGLPPD